jgi:hypothetical protein
VIAQNGVVIEHQFYVIVFLKRLLCAGFEHTKAARHSEMHDKAAVVDAKE